MAFALGLPAGTVATFAAAGLGAHDAPLFGLAVLTATAVALATLTSAPGAIGAAIQFWALWDGFLVNKFGELTFTHADWPGLVALPACAALASLVAAKLRAAASRQEQCLKPVDHEGPYPPGDREAVEQDRRCQARREGTARVHRGLRGAQRPR
ncbi:hypothetical protein PA7_05390 [Pseudonocardia asaccharolytica DSM 44247 = NBRC 16224]|uniref:Uncharacterized protein n=1 Tax=Pseudonocardia asaccharolytica DSM 44247 = NBRC 16224 TaxID=1123024 RepID=A0A511CVV4_9PSEU|nr:hypothetical protein PA7_05390 [Pseudonocardia asaccharolytica DSM 44247 = NBRC 16224]